MHPPTPSSDPNAELRAQLRALRLGFYGLALALLVCVGVAATATHELYVDAATGSPTSTFNVGGTHVTGTLAAARLPASVVQTSGNFTLGGTLTFSVAPIFADPAGTRTALGLATVASSGSASDLTGTLANARLSSDPTSGKTIAPAAVSTSSLTVANPATASVGGTFSGDGAAVFVGFGQLSTVFDLSQTNGAFQNTFLYMHTPTPSGTGFSFLDARANGTRVALIDGTGSVALAGSITAAGAISGDGGAWSSDGYGDLSAATVFSAVFNFSNTTGSNLSVVSGNLIWVDANGHSHTLATLTSP